MFASPGEIAFSIGRVSVYYYGIIMAIAIFVGILTAGFIAKTFYPELKPDTILDISPYVIVGAIIGARLYYCLLSFNYFALNPIEILQVWHGGLTIHGGILGGLLAGIWYAKRHSLPILKLCDIFSYGLVLGQAVGRWGNFFNSEAFGHPCTNFLKLYIPIYKRPVEFMQFDYFHPTFLYESVLDVCIFLILFFVVRKFVKKVDGIVFFTYLILYSIVRILIEQLRIDSVLNISGIPIAQIVSFFIIFLSVLLIFKITKREGG